MGPYHWIYLSGQYYPLDEISFCQHPRTGRILVWWCENEKEPIGSYAPGDILPWLRQHTLFPPSPDPE